MADRAQDVVRTVKFACACGKEWLQALRHYERVRCTCGAFYWVLQPRRDGPFQSFPWSPPQATAPSF